MILCRHFASHLSFLDPQKTEDGRPYGPVMYRHIVNEVYFITKNTSTSYHEVLGMTPLERRYMLQFLKEEFEGQKERIEQMKAENKS